MERRLTMEFWFKDQNESEYMNEDAFDDLCMTVMCDDDIEEVLKKHGLKLSFGPTAAVDGGVD